MFTLQSFIIYMCVAVSGQPEENLAFEAKPPFWAENPSTVRPTLANKP